MRSYSRRGFTLVELLVVMVVITMLIALLLPAVGAVRERGRQMNCTNNLKELSNAVVQYEIEKKHFPGWVNKSLARVNGQPVPLTWPVAILSYLGRSDLAREYIKQGPTSPLVVGAGTPIAGTQQPTFTCPSDPRSDAFAIAYVANCGQADYVGNPPTNDNGASGLFMNLYGFSQPMVRMTDVTDGVSETMMLVENSGALDWRPTWANPVTGTFFPFGPAIESQVGFVWSTTFIPQPAVPPTNAVPVPPNPINIGRNLPTGGNFVMFARPASNHPSLVLAAFCDGSVRSINDDVGVDVLRQMMTPNGSAYGPGY